MNAFHGVLVVDKPAGLTSSEVVLDVKRRLDATAAGHTGTLDPLATGVLPVCLGEATKLAGHLIAEDKAYEAELELGVETDSHDAEGQVVAEDRAGAARVTEAQLRAALAPLRGEIDQVPPMFSAVKIGGKPLFERARAGEAIDRAARRVTVHQLDLLAFEPPRARLAIACSKGTFVRGIVHDLGRALGCGAFLTALRRTRSGAFDLSRAVDLQQVSPVRIAGLLIRPADALDLPRVPVEARRYKAVLDGHPGAFVHLMDQFAEGARFQLVSDDGDLLAVCLRAAEKVRFERVFKYAMTAA